VQVQALTDELESSQDAAQAREDQLQADLAESQRQVCSLSAAAFPDLLGCRVKAIMTRPDAMICAATS
jgi:hypothetical protein